VWGAGAGEGSEPRKIASVEGITEYQLENGLRVLLFPDNSQSKVTVNMTVLVASVCARKAMAKQAWRTCWNAKALQEHGAQFNGSTSADRVNYFETLAATMRTWNWRWTSRPTGWSTAISTRMVNGQCEWSAVISHG